MNATPMPALIASGIPTNIRLPEGSKVTFVEADLHDICARIAHLDENLHVVVLEHTDGRAAFAITETDRQGVESLVMRIGPGCKIDALDGRVIQHIEWIRRIPVAERMAQIEKELEQERTAAEEQAFEKLYDSIGGSLYNNLHRLGFTDTPKPESRVPVNATARRAGRTVG